VTPKLVQTTLPVPSGQAYRKHHAPTLPAGSRTDGDSRFCRLGNWPVRQLPRLIDIPEAPRSRLPQRFLKSRFTVIRHCPRSPTFRLLLRLRTNIMNPLRDCFDLKPEGLKNRSRVAERCQVPGVSDRRNVFFREKNHLEVKSPNVLPDFIQTSRPILPRIAYRSAMERHLLTKTVLEIVKTRFPSKSETQLETQLELFEESEAPV